MPGRQPPPPSAQSEVAQRLRVRYARRGRLRFASHRDFQRALERALRRAEIPVAVSAGFSPHPRISYVGAAPTGASSEAEYLEIALCRRREPEWIRDRLDASLPDGLDVVEVVESTGGNLAERIDASRWRIELPGVAPAAAGAAVASFLAASSVPVERLMKDGRRQLDARAPVVALVLVPPVDAVPVDAVPVDAVPFDAQASSVADRGAAADCATLDLVVRHMIPAVRPDDVLTGLRESAGLAPPLPARVTRLAQGLLGGPGPADALADPLAPDRRS